MVIRKLEVEGLFILKKDYPYNINSIYENEIDDLKFNILSM